MSEPTTDETTTRKRTASEIEADLERTRAELTATVDELAARVDPREQVKEVTAQAKVAAGRAKEGASAFVADLRAAQPRALAIAGGVVAALAVVVAVSLRKK